MKAIDRAMQLRGQLNTGEQPHIKAPEKTIAGGLTSALGGAGTGAAMSMIPALAPAAVPLAIGGALLGGAEYFTS